MTIAEQITRAKSDLDAVYAAGKAKGDNALEYAARLEYLYYQAEFPPEHDELTVHAPNVGVNIGSMFRSSTGLKKLDLDIPPNKAYDGSYFFNLNSSAASTILEINLPDGIKFSNFGRFVRYCATLEKISGTIDLSECTSTDLCFQACAALEEVSFVTNTIKLGFDISYSKNLSGDSIKSIANGLAPATTLQTLTVPASLVSTFVEYGLTETKLQAINW